MHRSHSFRLTNRFTSCAGFLQFFAPDTGGGSGGGGKTKGTLEEQLTKALSDLTAAQTSVTSLTGERDTARNEVTTIKGQFESATKTATEAQSKVTGLETQITSLTGERDTANGKLTKAQENITRLESLCKIKGIAIDAAVPVVPDGGPASTHVFDQWQSATGSEKQRLYRANKAEIRTEGMRRGNDPRGN